jgi:hypothetical protein
MESPNTRALGTALQGLGLDAATLKRLYMTFSVGAEPFQAEAVRHDR